MGLKHVLHIKKFKHTANRISNGILQASIDYSQWNGWASWLLFWLMLTGKQEMMQGCYYCWILQLTISITLFPFSQLQNIAVRSSMQLWNCTWYWLRTFASRSLSLVVVHQDKIWCTKFSLGAPFLGRLQSQLFHIFPFWDYGLNVTLRPPQLRLSKVLRYTYVSSLVSHKDKPHTTSAFIMGLTFLMILFTLIT